MAAYFKRVWNIFHILLILELAIQLGISWYAGKDGIWLSYRTLLEMVWWPLFFAYADKGYGWKKAGLVFSTIVISAIGFSILLEGKNPEGFSLPYLIGILAILCFAFSWRYIFHFTLKDLDRQD